MRGVDLVTGNDLYFSKKKKSEEKGDFETSFVKMFSGKNLKMLSNFKKSDREEAHS